MNEIFFWSGLGLVLLMAMSKVPGLEHLVKPIIDLVFTAIKFVAENGVNWFIWLLKSLWTSHWEVLKHLIMSAESLDPTHDIRTKEA